MLIGRFGLRAGVMSDLRSRSIRLTVRVTRFGSENRENNNGCRGSSACVSWLRCGAVADMPLIKFCGSLGNHVHRARVVVTMF